MSEEISKEISKEKREIFYYSFYLIAYAITKSGGIIDVEFFRDFAERCFRYPKMNYAVAMGVKDAKNTQHTSTYIASKKQVLRFIEEALSDHEM